jgi:FKBP-type peptidyl-prolyl cis-trans isomerase (trigger factor)
LSNSRAHQAELNDRLAKLQGNLKLLEKKYRENLKEGFENKIKAYRLEAVFERKLLKNAIREIQK